MTEIFLGYPPEHIKNWIIEHSQANPPTGNETWVPASNLDGSPLTDTDHAKWVFSDGGGYNLKYVVNEEGGWDAWCGDQGNGAYMTFGETIGQPGATFINLDGFAPTYGVSAYRAYIPGHWEDADGNWINGSWSDWSNSNLIEWSKPNYSYIDEDKWIYKPDPGDNSLIVYPSEYDQNANLCQHATAASLIATRTWTNTKPAPENQ